MANLPVKYLESRMTVNGFTGVAVVYKFDPNTGHITCDTCGNDCAWCDHIKHFIQKNRDQVAIWQCDTLAEYPDSLGLQVPMFPTSNQWTGVSLEIDRESDYPRYKVFWNIGGTPLIANISPGEGRGIIRSLLVEYMYGDPARNKECKASHHFLKQQGRWERETAPGNALAGAQYWSVYTTDQCIGCRSYDTSGDDLVPDKEGSGVWSSSSGSGVYTSPGGITTTRGVC